MNRGEVADKGEPGPQRQRHPKSVFCRLEPELARRHRLLIEPHARPAVAFDLALDPHENLGIHGLRTGIAAPQPPGHGGEQKQRQRRYHQEPGEIDEILRPEDHAEDVELARHQVEQHRLAPVPNEPGTAVVNQLRENHQRPAPARKPPAYRARINFPADLI